MLQDGLWELPVMAAAMIAQASWLGGVYVVCLIVGGGLLVISTVLGGHGADTDADLTVDTDAAAGFDVDAGAAGGLDMDADAAAGFDVDADAAAGVDLHTDADVGVGADAHAHLDTDTSQPHAMSISNWFSIRFLVYFAAAFGLVGTALTYTSDLGPTGVLVVSIITGLVVGQGVHQTLRMLRKTSADGSTRIEQYVDHPARVTIAIHPPRRGEIVLRVNDSERYLPAAAKRPDDSFDTNDKVVVVGFHGGTVEVLSQREYEFTRNGKS